MRLIASAISSTSVALLTLCATPAWASSPDDISVSGMLVHQGQRLDQEAAAAQFDALAQQLGSAIANKPWAPARTLGSAGFDFSLGTTFVPINADNADDGTPSPWAVGYSSEEPNNLLIMPTVTMRKVSALGCQPFLRTRGEEPAARPFATDNGNWILDCRFPEGIADPEDLHARLLAIPGVLEAGLFLGLCQTLIEGRPDGTVEVIQRDEA